MNILYLDLFAGISGDMTLGAFIDLGVDEEKLVQGLKKLKLGGGYEIKISKSMKNGISASKVDVVLTEVSHGDHDHSNNHADHGHSHDRNLFDIEELIGASDLDERVKETSKKIFRFVARAEAKIHGRTIEDVHFHEVGALDSILDIVGTAICLNDLEVDKVIGSDVQVGTGFVYCQHGWIPVPAPASLEILREGGIPYYSNGIKAEMVTPTGAAILAGIVDEFGPVPTMEIGSIGYGAGTRDLEIPNILRMVYGKKKLKGMKA